MPLQWSLDFIKDDDVSLWFLIQIVINIFFLGALSICLVKVFRKQEDDPRLTQGLRLLQSKISILEDLSDHTETQVKQLMTLLDKKLGEVRGTMNQVNQHINEVGRSIQEGQKMAEKLCQEITTDQIIERKIESKYIQAARLAHQGLGVNQIVERLELPRADVELIVKVNKNKCIYESQGSEQPANIAEEMFARSLQMPSIETQSLEKTYSNFQKAVQDHKDKSEFRSIKLG